MSKEEAIRKFAVDRPDARAVYGYGSGVFKQASSDGKPLTDVIFLVNDLREWHRDNMIMNPKDYSLMGKVFVNRSCIDDLKGVNKITYFSRIRDGEFSFKYGVIEVNDFVCGLETWDNLFMVGRFHTPVLELSSEEQIQNAIDYNRKCALIIACLYCNTISSKEEIYRKICGLSYLGDARMGVAENPNKVRNIVAGSFKKLEELYPLKENFLTLLTEDTYHVDHDTLLKRIGELPEALLAHLYDIDTDFKDLEMLRVNIYDYIINRNSIESSAQILHGVKTNGIVRSVPYVMAKIKKRFSK